MVATRAGSQQDRAGLVADAPADLQRCVRDLVALSGLPALWIKADAPQIADSLAQLTVSILDADVACVILDEPEYATVHRHNRMAESAIDHCVLRQNSQPNARFVLETTQHEELHGLCVPLGRERGSVLIALSRQAGFPSEIAETLQRVAANQAGIAIERWRGEQALVGRTQELARLNATTDALYRLTDRLHRVRALNEVYEIGFDAIYEALGCSRASILLFDDEGIMRFVAWRGLSQSYRQAVDGHSPWTPDDADPRPICIDDVDSSDLPESLKAILDSEEIRALAFIPLMAAGKLVGKFMTYYPGPHEFDPPEVDTAMSIARQLSAGIERLRADKSRRRAEAERRRDRARLKNETRALSRLNELSSFLWRSKDLGDGLDEALLTAIELVGADMGYIQLLDTERQVLTIAAQHGFDKPFLDFFGQVSAAEGSACGRALRDSGRIVIEDIETDPEFAPFRSIARDAGFKAVQSTPLLGRDGAAVGMISTHFRKVRRPSESELLRLDLCVRQICDFVERVRADRLLQESYRRERERAVELQAVMDAAPAIVWIARDLDCRVIEGNAVSYDFLRLPQGVNASLSAAESERPANFEVLSEGRVLAPHELPVQRAARGERVADAEVEIRFEDGRSRHLFGNAVPLTDGTGNPVGAVAVLVDITERKREEQAARQLAAIVESSDDAIVSKDLNGTIMSWNGGAERLFGYMAEEAIGRSITMIIPPDRHQEETRILDSLRRGEMIDHYETVRRSKDGSLIDVSLTISPVRDGHGRITGASKIARDISERRRADMHRDMLIGELNHRVKNSLATVMSVARQSFRKGADFHQARQSFEMRILALAQSHTRLAETNWSGVQLARIFGDELAPYGYDSGGNVRLSGPPVAVTPRCALTLGMAVHELATNAAKYGALSTETGSVEVQWSVHAKDDELRICWKERGGPVVTPPNTRGFGSLLLERAFSSELQGEAQMDFAAEGLRCTIRLPLDESTTGDAGTLRPADEGRTDGSVGVGRADHRVAEPPSQIRVLVVEDEYLLANLVAEDLHEAGHAVVGPFFTLASAIAASREECFDLAVLDVNLGGDKVYLLADGLLERNIPAILLTGYEPKDLPERFRGLPRVAKPYNTSTLIRKIEQLTVTARV